MFYYLQGELAALEAGFAVIDCGGVGYRLSVTLRTRDRLAALGTAERSSAKLFTHLSVREDGIELFGFYDTDELDAFRLLTGVSGIGPRNAISILSSMSPSQLAFAVENDDRKTIGRAPGIGPKTAARIVLELRDKLGTIARDDDWGDSSSGIAAGSPSDQGIRSEAVDALLVLGFSRTDALSALRGIDLHNAALEDVVREALKKLMK